MLFCAQKPSSLPWRMAWMSQSSYSGASLSGVEPGRSGRWLRYSQRLSAISLSSACVAGSSAALLPLPALSMIQFQKRISNAPALRMLCRPMLDTASTGMTVVSCGTFSKAIACCVPPTYEVPTMPILPFDHGCAAIHAAQSVPSAPSSVIQCQTPAEA